MSETTTLRPVRILLYSDDRTVRAEVRRVLGRKVASDLGELEFFECATQPAVIKALEDERFDLLLFDGDATPMGGYGLSFQLHNELPECPPVLLLVTRIADAWLASWSRAEAISPYPIDPVRLPEEVAHVMRTHPVVDRRGTDGFEDYRPQKMSQAALGVGVH